MEIETHTITIFKNRKVISEAVTRSAKETEAFGELTARSLKGGEVIALSGDLGAGKTTFSKGLAQGLGVTGTVTSPTFVLMNVYAASHAAIRRFVHVDCYRLEQPVDLVAIGVAEYMEETGSVVAVEWPERARSLLPAETIWIQFEVTEPLASHP